MKAIIMAAMVLAACGCGELVSDPVEVRCIAVHIYGDTMEKMGWLNERYTYMTVERLDTKERRNFKQIYGKTGDVFVINWNAEHYTP